MFPRPVLRFSSCDHDTSLVGDRVVEGPGCASTPQLVSYASDGEGQSRTPWAGLCQSVSKASSMPLTSHATNASRFRGLALPCWRGVVWACGLLVCLAFVAWPRATVGTLGEQSSIRIPTEGWCFGGRDSCDLHAPIWVPRLDHLLRAVALEHLSRRQLACAGDTKPTRQRRTTIWLPPGYVG